MGFSITTKQRPVHLNEVPAPNDTMGRVTYQRADGNHMPLLPAAPSLYQQVVYYMWERSLLLQTLAGWYRYARAGRPMHPLDWEDRMACHLPHPPIDHVLASRGFE